MKLHPRINLHALIGLLILGGTAARAQIIYTNPADLTGPAIHIDMGTAGLGGSLSPNFSFVDKDFALQHNDGDPLRPELRYYVGNKTFELSPFGFVQKFALNDPIDGTLTTLVSAADGLRGLNNYGGNDANWAAGTTGYLGVQFNAGSGLVYGWIQASYNVDFSFTVYDFAYESSPGATILAGATGAIPEPSTYATFAGVAALGLAMVRRRRWAA
jgi:hypothetical protein